MDIVDFIHIERSIFRDEFGPQPEKGETLESLAAYTDWLAKREGWIACLNEMAKRELARD